MLNRADAIRQSPAYGVVLESMTRLKDSTRPIIVGPWLTEIGFEVLYWIPFLRWLLTTAGIDPTRLILVSRGGCAEWYTDLGSRYVDLFDLMSVAEFRQGNLDRVLQQNKASHRQVQKQLRMTFFDDLVIKRVRDHVGMIEKTMLLHPSLMYQLFTLVWRYQARMVLDAHTVYQPFRTPQPHGLELPSSYVAVKFYGSQSFPDTPKQREFVAATIRTLTKSHEVVLLNTELGVDDHCDLSESGSRVHRIDHLMTPSTNLQIQTRVIAGATRLVSTYGGFSYLGPLLGIPTASYFGDKNEFRADHLEIARQVFAQRGYGAFTVRPCEPERRAKAS